MLTHIFQMGSEKPSTSKSTQEGSMERFRYKVPKLSDGM